MENDEGKLSMFPWSLFLKLSLILEVHYFRLNLMFHTSEFVTKYIFIFGRCLNHRLPFFRTESVYKEVF